MYPENGGGKKCSFKAVGSAMLESITNGMMSLSSLLKVER
jgi:hypothetical protein